MSYRDVIQKTNTARALELLKINYDQQGGYLKFQCDCGKESLVKMYGEKKNLFYCPNCKAKGHIISLAMNKKEMGYEEACKFLEKASESQEPPTEELQLNYELEYSSKLEWLPDDFCKKYEIGIPKGKTMLSGCLTLTIRDEKGMKVAYYGINLKSGKHITHKSFNPEHYLLNYHNIDKDKMVYITGSVERWLLYAQEEPQLICNFGLPYLSGRQIRLIRELNQIVFLPLDKEDNNLIREIEKHFRDYLCILRR